MQVFFLANCRPFVFIAVTPSTMRNALKQKKIAIASPQIIGTIRCENGNRCTGWFSFNPSDNLLFDVMCDVGECPTCDGGCMYENSHNNSFLFHIESDPFEKVRGVFVLSILTHPNFSEAIRDISPWSSGRLVPAQSSRRKALQG